MAGLAPGMMSSLNVRFTRHATEEEAYIPHEISQMLLVLSKVALNLLGTAFRDRFGDEESDLDRMKLHESRKPNEHGSRMTYSVTLLAR